ncbi:ABC transporter substrate-binding protein [Nakamurella endophytica]|uniref:ABC transporter substrate-binding protein n=1 Tax=Nakamurella endophytica TaxID=1748367 RepID=A0A917T1K0_9ACTN|nr:ABC transporter substrate-binding protein [Nakamurella endophytica]GGM05744.1 ABC transporter substrate-binding protein [Nakamurella endophytica]
MFDPLYATDGETFRITRQMTEGLVTFKPGTADVEPALAESWTTSKDGLTWDFKVRSGVTFSDGTPLDAKAVCFNLDRMYSQTGAGATQAQYWSDTMGGFKGDTKTPSVYKSCTAKGASDAVVTLTRFTSKFPAILGLPSFSIQSPTALAKYDANDVKAEGDSFVYPAYATDHPTGTGPFVLTKYDKDNNTVTLTRNENYWGEKAKSKTLIFKIIPDETARKQELQAGTIDGYDLPNPADWDDLKSAGFDVLVRPAFNILYLGFDQKNHPALRDLKVRQAIAYALNREQFVSSQLPEGAKVAEEFYPDTVDGYTPDVTKYPYDPDKAKQLLAEAGASNLTLNFWWPTEVSRPYMPDPKAVFTAFKADLEAVGIKVNESSKPWNGGYLDGVDARKPDLFLLGWTGDYNTPDNFIGTFFSDPTSRFSTENAPWGATLSKALAAADSEPDDAKRNAEYVALNKQLLGEYLPAVPISHSPPAIVVSSKVQGLVPSPLTDEKFAPVSKTS